MILLTKLAEFLVVLGQMIVIAPAAPTVVQNWLELLFLTGAFMLIAALALAFLTLGAAAIKGRI